MNYGGGVGPRYTKTGLLLLMKIVSNVVPIGPDDWEEVAWRHFEIFNSKLGCILALSQVQRHFEAQASIEQSKFPQYITAACHALQNIEEQADSTAQIQGQKLEFELQNGVIAVAEIGQNATTIGQSNQAEGSVGTSNLNILCDAILGASEE